jgi:tyrosyl-tRNA synthetase
MVFNKCENKSESLKCLQENYFQNFVKKSKLTKKELCQKYQFCNFKSWLKNKEYEDSFRGRMLRIPYRQIDRVVTMNQYSESIVLFEIILKPDGISTED